MKHRRPRRAWKTFFITSSRDLRELESVWQSWPRSNSRHRMIFDRAVVETNVPLVELRKIFRTADAKWVDYVSDVAPSTDE